VGGSLKHVGSVVVEVEPCGSARQMDVAKEEWGGFWILCPRVFPWPKKEEKTEEEHVGYGHGGRDVSEDVKVCGMSDDRKWYGFDAAGRRI
jgi:hypothetical protein